MTATFGPWTLEQDGPLAALTIFKPPLNLFDREVDDGLHAAIRHVALERPRGLLLRAEGRVWTGGVDVNLFKDLDPQSGGDLWRHRVGNGQRGVTQHLHVIPRMIARPGH